MLLPAMTRVENKPLYEVGYHLLPTVLDEQIGAEVGKLREAIESRGGSVLSEEWPKSLSLAYGITHEKDRKKTIYDKSHFGWVRFEMEREQAADLQKFLKGLDSILRFIITSIPPQNARPQKKRIRPILKSELVESKEEKVIERDNFSSEEIDREIEKLVTE